MDKVTQFLRQECPGMDVRIYAPRVSEYDTDECQGWFTWNGKTQSHDSLTIHIMRGWGWSLTDMQQQVSGMTKMTVDRERWNWLLRGSW